MKYSGLTSDQLYSHYKQYGKNVIQIKKTQHWYHNVLEILKQPVFLLLIITALVYFFLGEPLDGSIMMVAVLFVIGIELYQQGKTDKTLAKLKDLSNPVCSVIRDNQLVVIKSTDLTIGDIVVVNEGDKISADGSVLESNELKVDESVLTGESLPVHKQVANDTNNYFKKNYLYASTLITSGNGCFEVTAIGQNTESGKIATDVASSKGIDTPLQKQINKLVRTFAIFAFVALILLVIISYLKTGSFIDSILKGIALALGLIPEEFPVIFTVFLTLGSYRLAINNAIVRKLAAVEALGSINMLFSDKTGTITKNKLTITHIIGKESEVLSAAAYASDANTFDPLELAIFYKKKVPKAAQLIKKYPFTSDSKIMANIYKQELQETIYAKGSAEAILKQTDLTLAEQNEIMGQVKELEEHGLRVIAVASKDIKRHHQDIFQYKLEYVGLLGLEDPPRAGVKEDIELCQKAGIHVVMITGDSGHTALSIARQVGLKYIDHFLSGVMIDKLNDRELYKALLNTSVVARVVPAHKSRIVKVCMAHRDVVAMTGDGVNDAPALKAANIGIAMGKRGTEVAKEASDLILLDDDFSTIVKTIKDARKIYENIRKASAFVVTVHIPLILLSLIIPLMGLPVLLMPILVVLFELITDPICSVVFERMPASDDLMDKKPRNVKESLISRYDILEAISLGVVIFIAAFIPYQLLHNIDLAMAKSMSLTVIFVANLLASYTLANNNHTLIKTILTLLKDKVILVINIIIILVVLAMLYLPALNNYIGTRPLSIVELVMTIFLATLAVSWFDIIKFIIHLKQRR